MRSCIAGDRRQEGHCLPRTGPKPEAELASTSSAEETDPAPADAQPAANAQPAADAQAAADAQPAADAAPRGRARALLRLLLRVTVALAVVVGVAAGIYVGWPVVQERYIAPIQANTADLDAMRARQAELQRQVDALVASQAELDARVGSIDELLAEHDRRLSTLDTMTEALESTDSTAAVETARQIRLLKAMELMSRARLFMYQSNFGLAEQDVQSAHGILIALVQGGSGLEGASITVAADRLARALAALPDFPVAASADLDIAWQAMLGDVPTPEPPTTTQGPEVTPPPTTEPSGEPGPTGSAG
jgi:hypothetical protein